MKKTSSVYVASSWRNMMQQATVYTLRAAGFDVYDFQNPPDGAGFGFEQVDLPPGDAPIPVRTYLEALQKPRAIDGFNADMDALKNSDICILVLPCGRSAHLELGWAAGAGKRTCVYAPEPTLTPELMYKMVDHIAPNMMDLLGWLGVED
jgi:hypothetical protein